MKLSSVALVLCVGQALAVFSQSDIDFLNSQKNYETRLQQAKIDCDQRIRDFQDGMSREKATWTANVQSSTSQFQQCNSDFQRVQTTQASFLGRFGQLVARNAAFAKMFPAGAFDANGNLVDLNAAFDVLVVIIRAADKSAQLEAMTADMNACKQDVARFQATLQETRTRQADAEGRFADCQNKFTSLQATVVQFEALRKDADTCRADAGRFRASLQEAQARQADTEGRFVDCQNKLTQASTSTQQYTVQITQFQQNMQACQADVMTLKKAADDNLVRYRQLEINLNTCTQQMSSNTQDSSSLRGKLQFLFDISGYCRQNFFSLANDKNALYSAFADLRAFVGNMNALTAIPGGMEDKLTFLANERSSFRRRVELIGVILNSLFMKVDDYTKILKTDGYERIMTGSGQSAGAGAYGSWIFNPAADGVDMNDLSSIDKCRAAVMSLKEKMTVLSSNLNTAVRNNNECLKKFNEASSVTLIGRGHRDDY